ncbi:hypothetical protein C7S16_1891 [Burkholderia thailandensis]|uniref:Uncharacterized protein n=1 Tax=Burkholderia thailandensis TaxID=57975 RepID=A0AAW9CZP6_BURTH|nr:hypothetical protein [Burkholderia thailandensis]
MIETDRLTHVASFSLHRSRKWGHVTTAAARDAGERHANGRCGRRRHVSHAITVKFRNP